MKPSWCSVRSMPKRCIVMASAQQQVRNFLFENTGVPIRYYAENDNGEGTQAKAIIARS